MSSSVADPVVHNSHGRAEITRMAGNDGLIGVHNAGLTRSQTELRIAPRAMVARFADGRACVMPELVTVSWKVTELTVHIASEYDPGSCAYREVKAHEDEHVRITTYTLHQFAPIMEARIRRAAAALRPTMGREDGQAAVDKMAAGLKAAGREVLAEFQAELRKRHAAIDTPESYREVSKRCKKW